VWTSRRLLLLIVAAAVFVASFVVYHRALGWIDGLPELPAKYLIRIEQAGPIAKSPNHEIKFHRLLRQAFGENCRELKYSNKLTLQLQGLVIATEIVDIEDGKLKLAPMSLAMFGKPNPSTEFPEINTVHCDVAWLTFDRPIRSLSDTNRARLVSAEFQSDPQTQFKDSRNGQILVVHNHGTQNAEDDVVLRTRGPIRFRDDAASRPDEPQLFTDESVSITDKQASPPHHVTSQGLRVFLTGAALPQNRDKTATRPIRNQPLVRRIELPANVQMDLTMSQTAGFLGNSQPNRQLATPVKPRLKIHTLGPFQFDVAENLATFSCNSSTNSGGIQDQVKVLRVSPVGSVDRLECDLLKLQLGSRSGTTTAAKSTAAGLHLTEVTATGSLVQVVAETESLHAIGTRLTYRQETMCTTISGKPVIVVKEGHKLQAPEFDVYQYEPLLLQSASDLQPLKVGEARGPGFAHLNDPNSKRSVEIQWHDSMSLSRTTQHDIMTVMGEARLSDRVTQQSLTGAEIRIWISEESKPKSTTPAETRSSHKEIRKLYATGNVQLHAADLQIHNTNKLVATIDKTEERPTVESTTALQSNAISVPSSSTPTIPTTNAPTGNSKRSGYPLKISAKSIETSFVQTVGKLGLKQARCTDRVHVKQEPTNANERGLEIHAQGMVLTHTDMGNMLRLTGPSDDPAQVIANEMTLAGTQINCDQVDNRAEVVGRGSMRLLVNSTLEGARLARAEEAAIYWSERMTFNGSWASFYGFVQAEHQASEVLCPRMDVYLDRRVNFQSVKPLQPDDVNSGNSRPEITRVVCHRDESKSTQPVILRNSERQNGRLTRFQQIQAPIVVYANDTGTVEVDGPGEVRMFQSTSTAELQPTKGESTGDKPSDEELKLTLVRFSGRMQGHTKDRWAKFFDDIRVLHLPTNNPLESVSDDRLAPRSFSMRCRQLVVRTRIENDKSIATMSAIGKAEILSAEFSGRADQIDYDDGKDQQVIFKGSGSSLASLNHAPTKGQPTREWHGRTIFYWRKSNQFKVVEAAGGTVPQ